MNLSATSVSVLVEELATRKLIDETGPAQTRCLVGGPSACA